MLLDSSLEALADEQLGDHFLHAEYVVAVNHRGIYAWDEIGRMDADLVLIDPIQIGRTFKPTNAIHIDVGIIEPIQWQHLEPDFDVGR